MIGTTLLILNKAGYLYRSSSSSTFTSLSPVIKALDFTPGLTDPKFKAFLHTNQFTVHHFTWGIHRSSIRDIGNMVSLFLDQ